MEKTDGILHFLRHRALHTLLAIGALIAVVILLKPGLREKIRSWVSPWDRVVISSTDTPVGSQSEKLRVIKIRNREGLVVEFYRVFQDQESLAYSLVDSIKLENQTDGYFQFNGQIKNLAVDDVDHDGQWEVLVPTFYNGLVGRLNIFKYNSQIGKFQDLTAR